MNKKTVLLVSAFGRGHWLATQLQRSGVDCVLLDVTERIGSWIPEEAEGPFGIFQSDKVLESQTERLLEDESPLQSPSGFNLWLKNGPVEFKGPMTKHRIEKMGTPDSALNYILTGKGKNKIESLPYYQKWLVALAHSFASRVYLPSVDEDKTEEFLPLFSSFFVRLASRVGHYRSLDWCERQGVQVLRKADIIDISMRDRHTIKGLEIRAGQNDRTEIFEADKFIWSLTSEETGMLGAKSQAALFPRGVIEPDWFWCRYRVKISEHPNRQLLPLHMLILDDIGRPWTHDNFIVLIKTGSPELFDVWCRLPNLQRFNKDYLMMRGQSLIQILEARLVQLKVNILNYPIGYELTFKEVGPARHPLYDPIKLNKSRTGSLSNVYFDSPEVWKLLGWNGMFQHQIEIFNQVQTWWNKLLAKKKKDEGSKGAEL